MRTKLTKIANSISMTAKIAFAILLLALTACGGDRSVIDSPKADQRSEQQIIEERVNARWNAFVNGDYRAAYNYATPAYRAAYDFSHFSNQYGNQIKRTGSKVHEVNFDPVDPTSAKVVVLLYFVTEGQPGHPYEGYSRIVETWVKRDGQWWHSEKS